jgi:NADH:ubiquinone reductase (H+-translocating)
MSTTRNGKQRIVILGGGFAGIYTAIYLEKLLGSRDDFEIALVNRENYMVYQPMLAEIVSGNVGLVDTISPIRRLLKRTELYVREVEGVDLQARTVTLGQGFRPRPHVVHYDHLVLATGSVTDFRGMPGMPEHAMPFKNLADAIHLRNHLIHILEQAAIETDPDLRKQLLTFVVAGGGFSGTEVVGEMNDFVRHVAKTYPKIDVGDIRVVLVHMGPRVLDREMSEELGVYATNILRKRGVEVMLNTVLTAASPEGAILANGDRLRTKTLVSTVPASPNPVIERLGVPKDRGKVKTDLQMQVEGTTNLWAIGDCALIPDPAGGGFCPPTAQHAIREANVAAHNIVASIRGTERTTFDFKGLGKLGLLGRHTAVAEMFGVKLSGLPAWLVWRAVYWSKLPGLDRKLKTAVSWFMDLLVQPELVQLRVGDMRGVAQAHFEPGDVVFHQGDLGDSLYIILQGEAEVVREDGGDGRVIARLGSGEYFGEMALLNENTRGATVRAAQPMDVLILRKGDFSALVANLPDLRQSFEGVMVRRQQNTREAPEREPAGVE